MRNLFKTDLLRILKDKLFMVVCILGGVFALLSPLLYELIVVALDVGDAEIGMIASAKSLFFTAFSPSGNFGLILPILLSIVLCKDFSYGTVRNKIICGKTRFSIFLSMFLSGTVVICGVMLAHALLTLGISLIFFPYQVEPFTVSSVFYLIASLFLSLLIYVFISAIVCFFSVLMKNVGLAIVMYVAVNFLASIVGTILMVASMFISPEKTALIKTLDILQKANVFTSTHIGTGVSYTASDVLCVLLPTLLGTAICLYFGSIIFKKKDLK